MIVDDDGEEYVIFDDHTHMGKRPNPGILSAHGRAFDDATMIERMDASGVDLVVGFPLANPHTDYREYNELMLSYQERNPERIAAFARIQPLFRETAADHIAEYAKRGAKGLKFHPFMDGGANPVNDPDLMFPLMDVAAECGLPVLIHSGESWNCSPALIGDLAENFPKGRFIIGHSGLWEGHQQAIIVARRYPNIYLDVAEVGPPGVITAIVSAIGSDRVLYGSDHPFIPMGYEIGKIAKYAGLSVADKRKILGTNLAGLLGLEPTRRSKDVVSLRDI
jgi:predicted TIM-barrel fold metal-dependent hydrolase